MKKFAIIWMLLFITTLAFGKKLKVKPYQQFATQHEITILWESRAKAYSKVYYGPARFGDTESNLELEKTLIKDTLKNIHEVKLNGLEPNTTYFYQVATIKKSGKESRSKIYTFQTAVRQDESFAFSVFSDSQDFPKAWGKISKLAWADRPNFAIHGGDIVRTGAKKRHWVRHYFRKGHPFLSRFPVYTVLGNHEGNAHWYYKYMANPAPEYYYTFHYGNAQFFMLDTNKDVGEGSEQYNWLAQQLKESLAEWKFVVHHHPPYSNEENDHGDTKVARSTLGIPRLHDLVIVYEKNDVDVVFYGHIHLYERTLPLYQNKVDRDNGVHYICIGGANGHLEDFKPTRAYFTADLKREHHYGKVVVFDNRLEFKAIDHHDKWFDYLVIEK